MSLLVCVISNDKDKHVYLQLGEKHGQKVVLMTMYARKSLSEWYMVNKQVMLAVEPVNNLKGGLEKVRGIAIERGVYIE